MIATKTMASSDVWREVVSRQISLVPSFDGRIWTASVDEKGATVSTRKRKVRMIFASASSPTDAVRALIEKLDTGQARMWEEAA